MLSTNAFAQSFADVTDDTWQYTVNPDPDDASKPSSTATLNGFVDAKKGTVENLVIPAEVTGEGGVKYTITKINADAFKNDAKIKTVTFTAAVTEIGASAFNNVYNLTTLTFPEGSKLATIGNYAFGKCDALTKIDLSKTQVVDFKETTPFVDDTPINLALEEIVLSANTTNIGTALANLKVLAKTNISATRVLSIGASAFANDAKLTSLELPEVHLYDKITGQLLPDAEPTTLKADALKDSYIATLTINGAVPEGGIAALGAKTLTEVNFKGKLATGAIMENAFVGNKKLAKVTIAEAEKKAIAGGSFTDCAFGDDAAKTLTFTITKATEVVFADQKAFAADVVADKDCNVTIVAPNAAVGTDVPFRAKFTPKADELPQIKVYGTSTLYGKFINKTGKNVAIKRADATVYSVYVDGAKVYMDPLKVADTQQVIAPGEAVIIKTTSTSAKGDDGNKYVEYTETTENPTMRYASSGGDPINDLEGLTKTGDEFDYASSIKSTKPTMVLYVVGDLSKGLQWLTPKDAVRLYDNTVYIFAEAEKAGRLTTIWLDGSEPTAIQKIETKSENNDAIYNLQGVRVNKAGKGIYIQNGKKFIVK